MSVNICYGMTEKEWTAVRVSKELRDRLEERKVHPNQPFWEVIEELLDEVESDDEEVSE